ncbi:MAG: ABC transporter substrate-binding protein [Chloroflexi bacterium]|nr:ABC transporter substrate-binding protein [Chloroflexota bacterium]
MKANLTCRLVTLLVVSVLVLTACQAAPPPSTPSPATKAPAAAPAAAAPQASPASAPPASAASAPPAGQPAAAAPKAAAPPKAEPKGKLTVAMGVDADTLDPHMTTAQSTSGVLANVYEGLTTRDDSMKVVPQLAESWRPVDDTTWEFKLRKGVKFQNGEDFNAEAVKFSLDRVLNPATKSTARSYIDTIKEVKVVDPSTVRMVTDGPAPSLPARLALRAGWVLPPGYVKEKGDQYLTTHPVGTGPFKFVQWVKDENLTFEANLDYWGGPPKLKTLTFKPVPEASARIAALQTGTADIVVNVPADQTEALGRDKRFAIQAVPSLLVISYSLDSTVPGPLQDKRVRQAINYAVDKDAIVKEILRGYGRITPALLSQEVYSFDDSIKPYPYDPNKAKALLAEAGQANGFKVNINTSSGRYSADKEVAQAIANYLSKIGLQPSVKVWEWANYAKSRFGVDDPGSVSVFGFGGAGAYIPEVIYWPMLGSGQTYSTTKDPVLDKLLTDGARAMDDQKRVAIFREAQQRVREEAYRLFLYQQYDIYGVNNRVENWKPRGDQYLMFQGVSAKD